MKSKMIIFYLLIPTLVVAQNKHYNIYGYIKYLFTTSKLPIYSSDRLNDHIIHSRVNTRWYLTESITGALELRVRGFYGGSVKNLPDFKQQIKTEYEYYNLDVEFWSHNKSIGYGQIDRLFLDYSTGNLEITAGRQRIAWGTSLVWNITDLFNPKSVLDFDYEENPGVDALRIQYYTGAVTKVEAVIKPGENKYNRTFAGLWSINAWTYDFFFLVAHKNNRKFFGTAWTGNIKGAGFRGELIFIDPPSKNPSTKFVIPSHFGSPFTDYTKRVYHIVLSGDYTFPNSFYIHTEILHNSNGKKTNAGPFYIQINEVNMLSPARWSIFQEFSYNISALIRGSIFGIYNPNDRSKVVMPSISWSASENLDLMLLGIFTGGQDLSEFGNFGSSIYLRFKYSF
jgi:hypothetical protein